jgi:hypothetical protein
MLRFHLPLIEPDGRILCIYAAFFEDHTIPMNEQAWPMDAYRGKETRNEPHPGPKRQEPPIGIWDIIEDRAGLELFARLL